MSNNDDSEHIRQQEFFNGVAKQMTNAEKELLAHKKEYRQIINQARKLLEMTNASDSADHFRNDAMDAWRFVEKVAGNFLMYSNDYLDEGE